MQVEITNHTKREEFVKDIFSRIAPHYDRMNRLMTGGQDLAWRRKVILLASLSSDSSLLDLGCGTGDLAVEAERKYPGLKVIASDFTPPMLLTGKMKHTQPIHWSAANAASLPFSDCVFDAVVSGFLLRNVSDIDQCIREQFRVIKPGGTIVCLDTTRPPNDMPFWLTMYLKYVVPTLGRWITGETTAYQYLPQSTLTFLDAETLAKKIKMAGFSLVGFDRTNFNTIAIHWAKKL